MSLNSNQALFVPPKVGTFMAGNCMQPFTDVVELEVECAAPDAASDAATDTESLLATISLFVWIVFEIEKTW